MRSITSTIIWSVTGESFFLGDFGSDSEAVGRYLEVVPPEGEVRRCNVMFGELDSEDLTG
jgi:hypothetical protein